MSQKPNRKKTDRSEVSGYQGRETIAKVPKTPSDLSQLLKNPERPAELQSAPTLEQLNPHLFPRSS